MTTKDKTGLPPIYWDNTNSRISPTWCKIPWLNVFPHLEKNSSFPDFPWLWQPCLQIILMFNHILPTSAKKYMENSEENQCILTLWLRRLKIINGQQKSLQTTPSALAWGVVIVWWCQKEPSLELFFFPKSHPIS